MNNIIAGLDEVGRGSLIGPVYAAAVILNKNINKKILKDSKKLRNKTNFFAKRFAAKEAFVKALGTGFRKGVNFNDIYVKNETSGKPVLKINAKIKKIISKKFNLKKFKIFLSLSDEKSYSIAFVIIKKV